MMATYALTTNPRHHYYTTRNGRILGIVLHVTAGLEDFTPPDSGAESTVKYGQSNTRPASWHGIVDSDSIIESLPEGMLRAADKTSSISAAAATKLRVKGPFPLPKGHWFGVDDGTPRSHSGARARDEVGVKQIQAEVGVAVDGRFGPATERAVKAWQAAHGLTADGLAGAGSLTAAGKPVGTAAPGLTGAGSLAWTAKASVSRTGTITGSGAATASGTVKASGTATLGGAGSVTATSGTAAVAAGSTSGSGSLTGGGTPHHAATAALSGSGSLAGSASGSSSAAPALGGAGQVAASSTISTGRATAAKTLTVGADYRLRIDAIGPTVRARVWPLADPEPTGWDVTADTVAKTTAGYLGIVVAGTTATPGEAQVVQYDDITITAGATGGYGLNYGNDYGG